MEDDKHQYVCGSIHRLLKKVYLEGKQNRRLDHLLCVLFQIVKDKAFARFIKINKGKVTQRVTEINKRHKRGEEMMKNGYDIDQINNGWTIRSERDTSIHYTLQKETSCNNCQLRCSYCRAYVHAYSCTCIDSITHTTHCMQTHAHTTHHIDERHSNT